MFSNGGGRLAALSKREKPYTVKAVARVLGVSPNTIRSWEIRYGAVTPERTETNRRAYTHQHVERLKLILSLLNRGHSIGSVARLPEKELHDLLGASKPAHSGREKVDSSREILLPILEALKDFEFTRVAELLELSRVRSSTRDFVLNVVSPLMGKVGEWVAKRKLSIAQEHALSAIIRDQIGQTIQLLRRETLNRGPTFLFATPEGDLHEFGILLGATLCANYGYRAYYLGANLPADALAIAVKALKPSCLVLGNSPRGDSHAGPPIEEYLRQLNKSVPGKIEVWIGGQGHVPHLRAVLGKRKYEALKSLDHFDQKIRGSR